MPKNLPPRVIALCGHPGSGKSTAQRLLEERFGVIPVDDGWPMRDVAIEHLGFTREDVTTQEGKARTVEFAGKEFQVRWFLGEFGNCIEALLGPDAIPLMAARRLEPGKIYSIGSCRRDQGLVWKKLGGIVVQIDNPAVAPSQYEFDRFDEGLVNCVITNDLSRFPTPELKRIALARRLDMLMHRVFGLRPFTHGAAA